MTSHSLIIHLVYWIAISFDIFFLYLIADPTIWIPSNTAKLYEKLTPYLVLIGLVANASFISYFYFFV